MEKLIVEVIYDSGVTQIIEASTEDKSGISKAINTVQESYKDPDKAGYIQIPDQKDGSIVFVNLLKTSSIKFQSNVFFESN